MSTEADILMRLRELEKQVAALLELHPEAVDRLRPRDAMAICDQKGTLKPGPIVSWEHQTVDFIARDQATGEVLLRGGGVFRHGDIWQCGKPR